MRKLRLQTLRLLLWRRGGNQIAAIALYLLGHGMHWWERHKWLGEHGPVQVFQRGLGVIALVVGFVYMVTGKQQQDGKLARLLDHSKLHPGLWPHQWFGLLLFASSLLLIIAVYEWPVKSEWSSDNPATEGMTDARLRSLFVMQLAGHMVAMTYWGMSGALLLGNSLTNAWGWGSLTLFLIHRSLYIRNNQEYQKERAEIRRWRNAVAEQRRKGASLSSALWAAEHGPSGLYGLREHAGTEGRKCN